MNLLPEVVDGQLVPEEKVNPMEIYYPKKKATIHDAMRKRLEMLKENNEEALITEDFSDSPFADREPIADEQE